MGQQAVELPPVLWRLWSAFTHRQLAGQTIGLSIKQKLGNDTGCSIHVVERNLRGLVQCGLLKVCAHNHFGYSFAVVDQDRPVVQRRQGTKAFRASHPPTIGGAPETATGAYHGGGKLPPSDLAPPDRAKLMAGR